mmetsp:Transcript_2492/g.6291  ORF Transcript_2492/g.6291 Transcript_2492/m.6291 type:complete len:314 (-) Transcript_2492:2161-3102(-)
MPGKDRRVCVRCAGDAARAGTGSALVGSALPRLVLHGAGNAGEDLARAPLSDGGCQHRPTGHIPERVQVDGAQLLRQRASPSREAALDEGGGQAPAPPLRLPHRFQPVLPVVREEHPPRSLHKLFALDVHALLLHQPRPAALVPHPCAHEYRLSEREGWRLVVTLRVQDVQPRAAPFHQQLQQAQRDRRSPGALRLGKRRHVPPFAVLVGQHAIARAERPPVDLAQKLLARHLWPLEHPLQCRPREGRIRELLNRTDSQAKHIVRATKRQVAGEGTPVDGGAAGVKVARAGFGTRRLVHVSGQPERGLAVWAV